jgi:sugar-specific transcriptional regulator TrmB
MRKLGFTEYETRIYIRLLQESPATAYEISKATGVPRPNTYTALDTLAQRDVVHPVSADPVRYVPVPPDLVFGRIASSTRSICDDLAQRLKSLSEPDDDSRFVWTTHGDTAVHDHVRQMIEAAENHIWIKAGEVVVRRHAAALREAAARGVSMVIVLFGEDADEFRFSERVRVVLHEGNGRRMGMADNLFTVIVDHEEVMTANIDGSVSGAHTRNRSIVIMALGLLRHEYYLAEIFRRLGDVMTAEFGPHLTDLRSEIFTPEQFAAFRAQVGRAPAGEGAQ